MIHSFAIKPIHKLPERTSALRRKNGLRVTALRLIALSILAAAAMTSCIKNDIPYPRIQPNFTSFEAEGLKQAAEIDSINRLMTLSFEENVDLENVIVTSYTLSPEGAELVGDPFNGPVDFSSVRIVTLKLYQEYDWVIQARQTIERYFEVENQVGATVIDVSGQRVSFKVTKEQGLKNVKVLKMKLGPTGCITSPALVGETLDFTRPIEVKIISYGKETTWTIIGEEVESTVSTERADAWTQVAWVYGSAVAGRDNGVEYRRSDEITWTKAPKDWVTETGATFCARLLNLEPQTEYVARAYSDTEYGKEIRFTTGRIVQVPNSSLDEWCKVGRVWNPWPENGTPYWDTGNKGATTLGESNTTPTDDTSSGTGQAAMLKTVFVGIGIAGKLAAGNIFAGYYVRTDGTNGVLSFGREFSERPTKLTGYLKYNSETINYSSSEMDYLKGRPDTCIVWCALIDSNEPFEIRTRPANRQLFDPQGEEVVAYGQIQFGETVPQYIPFEFDLEYTSTSRVPKYILIVASASKYGDYFTGGAGSTLYLDDLNLLYDY